MQSSQPTSSSPELSPSRTCPLCHSADSVALGPIRYGHNAVVADQDASQLVSRLGRKELLRCRSCGFRWTHPYDFSEDVHALYRQNHETHWEAAAGRNWDRYMAQLLPYLPPSGKALDVGCYTGDFLAQLGTGWERHGVEPIPYAAARARERGIEVYEGLLETAPYTPGDFDLITLWDVAEHLPDPRVSFAHAASLLKPGGILALETGNASCPIARLMGPDWWYVALLEHCSFYTETSFRQLFSTLGFSIEQAIWTHHHDMSAARRMLKGMQALAYRGISVAAESGAGWAEKGPFRRLLSRRAPFILLRDHLLVIAKRQAVTSPAAADLR